MELKEKVVLITGSSLGIGKASAIEFAKEGAKVVVTYNSHKKDAEKVLKECKKLTDAIMIQLDVTKMDSIKNCVEKTIDEFGAIDVLVNNAGVLVEKNLLEQSFDEIKFGLDVNLTGLINMTKIVLPYMLEEEGIIINIASVAGKRVKWPDVSIYTASKFGVRGFTQCMAKEYEGKNIRFYAVNPGGTATQMNNFDGISPEKVAKVIVKTAKENLGKKSGDDVDVPDYL
ncbi:MAG: SDR family oxidoreductase [Nanoarchaeota archaeon]